MKKILITGIAGFAGSYLAEYLLLQGQTKILGTCLSLEKIENLKHIEDRIHLRECDLQSEKNIDAFIGEEKPDVIFHLAALTAPSMSFQNPEKVITNNIAAEIYVLEALRKHELFDTRILIISSADVYGKVDQSDLPIDEDTKLQPTNPYAVSKIAQDYLGLQYFLSYKLPIVRVRPFNHIGPRQAPSFVVPSFAKQIAEIEKKKKEPILRVGDLSPKRDFTDVRDMVRAYDLAVTSGITGDVYNIGSGYSLSIKDILEKLLSFSSVPITVMPEETLMRPSDNPELVCNAEKFTKLSNWQPTIGIDQTLKDTLDYWRGII